MESMEFVKISIIGDRGPHGKESVPGLHHPYWVITLSSFLRTEGRLFQIPEVLLNHFRHHAPHSIKKKASKP